MGALGVGIAVGALTGVADALLTLVANPDPGLAAHQIGYLLGPILLSMAWAAPVAMAAGWVAPVVSRADPGAAAAAAVASAWAASLALHAWRAGQTGWALVTLAVFLAVGALALGTLGLAAARAAARLAAPRRRFAIVATSIALVGPIAWATPASLGTFGGGGGPCPSPASPRPRGPNIILVTVDALRADAAREMQTYRRLAARGQEFTQHLTTAPWTLPSVASLLTGRLPARHGAGRSLSSWSLIDRTPLAPDIPTIAGLLGAHGYRTHAIVTNPFLTSRYGIDSGFCTFENLSMAGETLRSLAQTSALRVAREVVPGLGASDRAHVVRERAEQWLGAHDGRPFLLWLHFLDPHAPYGDRDGSSTSLALDLMALQDRRGPDTPFSAIGLLRAGEYRPDRAERERIAALYRQDVAYVDRQLEGFLDLLDDRGLTAHTAIVFTADHGEEFWEHGGVEHGRTLFEEVLRVPLVIAPPGSRSPGRREDLTSVIDVTPTILALAGRPRDHLEGVDLLEAAPVSTRAFPLGDLLFGEAQRGLRAPTRKYIRSEHGEERLYDLVGDPAELANLAAGQPSIVAAMRQQAPGSPAR